MPNHRDRSTAVICGAAITATRHRACCRIPRWTAYVGQPWKPYDEAPWNLYNVWWLAGQWIAAHAESEGS